MNATHPRIAPQLADEDGLEQLESSTQSFIVKIWLEEAATEAGRAVWRGHITHIPSNQRRYIESLSDIQQFIIPYLEELGVDTN